MADNLLGQATAYVDRYAPELLYPIPREVGRARVGIPDPLPFDGVDRWNAYELSWLNPRGKPVVAVGEIEFPVTSPNLVESKSLKLYLNSLNGMRYASAAEVGALVRGDLEAVSGGEVTVRLSPVQGASLPPPADLPGRCIDDLDVDIADYSVNPDLLDGSAEGDEVVEETVHSHLLRSNCPVTGQPDWGSVRVAYRGPRIDERALLRYLVSFRNHDDYHEQCVERMFADLLQRCRPEGLTVQACYTRRGGLDINPFRSNWQAPTALPRLWRQ